MASPNNNASKINIAYLNSLKYLLASIHWTKSKCVFQRCTKQFKLAKLSHSQLYWNSESLKHVINSWIKWKLHNLVYIISKDAFEEGTWVLWLVSVTVCFYACLRFLLKSRISEANGQNSSNYRKVASTNASRFVTRLVYMHTQNDNFLIRSPSWI